jgi:hypothetical protein
MPHSPKSTGPTGPISTWNLVSQVPHPLGLVVTQVLNPLGTRSQRSRSHSGHESTCDKAPQFPNPLGTRSHRPRNQWKPRPTIPKSTRDLVPQVQYSPGTRFHLCWRKVPQVPNPLRSHRLHIHLGPGLKGPISTWDSKSCIILGPGCTCSWHQFPQVPYLLGTSSHRSQIHFAPLLGQGQTCPKPTYNQVPNP